VLLSLTPQADAGVGAKGTVPGEPDDESAPIITGVGSPARRKVGFKGLGSSAPGSSGARGRREGLGKEPRALYAGSKGAVKKKRMIDADTEYVQRLTMGTDEPPSPWIENVGKQVRVVGGCCCPAASLCVVCCGSLPR
jgi:hypothetical protein